MVRPSALRVRPRRPSPPSPKDRCRSSMSCLASKFRDSPSLKNLEGHTCRQIGHNYRMDYQLNAIQWMVTLLSHGAKCPCVPSKTLQSCSIAIRQSLNKLWVALNHEPAEMRWGPLHILLLARDTAIQFTSAASFLVVPKRTTSPGPPSCLSQVEVAYDFSYYVILSQ